MKWRFSMKVMAGNLFAVKLNSIGSNPFRTYLEIRVQRCNQGLNILCFEMSPNGYVLDGRVTDHNFLIGITGNFGDSFP